ncbi:hypothetical protein F4604DRAFT_1598124 [Suillus subluteus]|nr:hypothetical protein F4604DRAFT_1598124 [Suillus subluteus]
MYLYLSDVNIFCTTVYCVHWLRTLALRDRWAEELLLVGQEMIWTVDFFLHKSQRWVGHWCYAARQAQIYLRLLQQAQDSFERTKGIVLT